jgi:uncharacterized membrane protein YbaN (DUF454 family)
MSMLSGKGIVRRKAWTAAGTLFVVLGAIGALLPVMPTTPFLLLAAGCYARGSPRAYRRLMENRLFGQHLSNYSEGKGLTVTAKAGSISAVIAGTSFSAVMTGLTPLMTLILAIVAGAVMIHLLLLPTCGKA